LPSAAGGVELRGAIGTPIGKAATDAFLLVHETTPSGTAMARVGSTSQQIGFSQCMHAIEK
jgi:hypothetical protein